ncbi:hypothetical protein SNK04_014287 [Fusarium graminearum]
MGVAVIRCCWGATILAAGAAVQQGIETKKYNDYLANQAEADKRTAQSAAEREQIRSNAIAELAASGVDVNSDTALRIDQQIVRDSEEDAFLALAGGTDRANRLDAEAQGYRNTGKQARTAGYVNAGSSLLRGASNNSYGRLWTWGHAGPGDPHRCERRWRRGRSGAVANLGQTGMAVADRAQTVVDQEARRQKQQDETLARAKALNAQLDYEMAVQDATLQTEDSLATGGLDHRQAGQEYSSRWSRSSGRRAAHAGQMKVQRAVQTAQRADLRNQVTAGLDKLGKIAGMPGADIDAVNLRADELVGGLGRSSGLDDAASGKLLQDFKDRNWTTHATQQAIFNREDPAGLAKLEHDLSAADGFYANKLDPEKRNALLSQVVTRQQTLLDRAERAQDRLDAKGQRVIDQIDRQIASGVPATPDMWAKWADTVKGTSTAVEFQERVEQEKVVQGVLRLGPDQQQAFVQQEEAKLLSAGGTVAQKANLDRLKNAVEANQKQLLDAPLLYNAAREVRIPGIPADAWEIGSQLNDRMATIQGMRKRWGTQVQERLLLPQEVKVFADTLKNSTAVQQTAMLEPVVAYAGMLATKERASVTTAKHWFSPNETVGARDVSATMLEGNRILQQKGDIKFPIPPDKDFRTAFTDATGQLFAGRPGAADVAMQASGQVDSTRMRQAIRASLGEVVDINGRGEVLAPWGMSEGDFEDRAEAAFTTAARAAGLPDSTVGNFGAFGLAQSGENTFFVKSGMSYLYKKDGTPLMIRIDGSSQP